MINGELKGGHLLWYDEACGEEKTIDDTINVISYLFIFRYSKFVFPHYFWLLVCNNLYFV
jgi:hypothetical protein